MLGTPKCDSGRRRLPGLPLLAVAVGEHAEHLGGLVEIVQPQRKSDPEAHREALPQRAGRDLDAGRALHVGVALELGADLAQPHQVLEREVAVLGEGGVLDRRRVALAEDEAVARRPVRVVRVVPKDPVVERGEDVGRRQRRVEVAGLRDREHPHAVDAQDGRPALELGDARLRRTPLGEPGRRLGIRYRRQVPHGGEISVQCHERAQPMNAHGRNRPTRSPQRAGFRASHSRRYNGRVRRALSATGILVTATIALGVTACGGGDQPSTTTGGLHHRLLDRRGADDPAPGCSARPEAQGEGHRP